jgi:hypothetical protein
VEIQAVYDIANAGHRTRFVVKGDAAPFIVHNCENAVQAVAGALLKNALLCLHETHPQLVVGHTHDEVIGMCPVPDVADGRVAMERAMLDLPDWGAGLPVACEASESFYYTKTID